MWALSTYLFLIGAATRMSTAVMALSFAIFVAVMAYHFYRCHGHFPLSFSCTHAGGRAHTSHTQRSACSHLQAPYAHLPTTCHHLCWPLRIVLFYYRQKIGENAACPCHLHLPKLVHTHLPWLWSAGPLARHAQAPGVASGQGSSEAARAVLVLAEQLSQGLAAAWQQVRGRFQGSHLKPRNPKPCGQVWGLGSPAALPAAARSAHPAAGGL